MDKQHNWLSTRVAAGEEASRRIDDKAAALRDEWFDIGHAFLAAKELYPSTQAFGEWLRRSPMGRWTPNERSCAQQLAKNETLARKVLEGTNVANVEWMWQRVRDLAKLFSSYEASELDPRTEVETETAVTAENPRPIEQEALPENDKSRSAVVPKTAKHKGYLEKQIGDDGKYVRGWYAHGRADLADGIGHVRSDKLILEAIAAACKSGECKHAAVAGSRDFDIRMVFPHIPEAVAKAFGRKRDGKSLRRKKGERSDWDKFAELNDLCKARSSYTVEKPAPNGTYLLRAEEHEREIGQQAWQWWQHGHWPGEKPKLQLLANAAAPPPAAPVSHADEVNYFGMVLWPIEPTDYRPADAANFPTKQDVDNTYWLVEEMHRALVAARMSHETAARYVRNWSKYVGQLQKPVAAAKLMQEMAQGIDIHGRNPERNLDLKNKIPGRPIRFAAER